MRNWSQAITHACDKSSRKTLNRRVETRKRRHAPQLTLAPDLHLAPLVFSSLELATIIIVPLTALEREAGC